MLKISNEQLEDIRRASKYDVVGPVKLVEDINSDYEVSKHVSFHDVVVVYTEGFPNTFHRVHWEVTKEYDPELDYDSLTIMPVKPKVVQTIEYVEVED